jgi:F0F1-type ATP synthase membrane subunit b/b'
VKTGRCIAPACFFSATLYETNIFMTPKLQEQIDEQEIKINEILTSVRKTEKYMRLTFWTTIGVVVLPLVLFAFAIPMIMNSLGSYTSTIEGLI